MQHDNTAARDPLPNGIARVLFSEMAIERRVSELAAQISHDYAEGEHIFLVGVLKGAFIFLADLARQIAVSHTIEFIAVSSYGARGATSGAVRLLMDVRQPLEGQHVILVEDIVDTGQTIAYLNRMLQGRQPASLRRCAFLRKPHDDQGVDIDYLGFEIPDVWVVGYGLDYADQFRTLPYIAELKPEVYRSDATFRH